MNVAEVLGKISFFQGYCEVLEDLTRQVDRALDSDDNFFIPTSDGQASTDALHAVRQDLQVLYDNGLDELDALQRMEVPDGSRRR